MDHAPAGLRTQAITQTIGTPQTGPATHVAHGTSATIKRQSQFLPESRGSTRFVNNSCQSPMCTGGGHRTWENVIVPQRCDFSAESQGSSQRAQPSSVQRHRQLRLSGFLSLLSLLGFLSFLGPALAVARRASRRPRSRQRQPRRRAPRQRPGRARRYLRAGPRPDHGRAPRERCRRRQGCRPLQLAAEQQRRGRPRTTTGRDPPRG